MPEQYRVDFCGQGEWREKGEICRKLEQESMGLDYPEIGWADINNRSTRFDGQQGCKQSACLNLQYSSRWICSIGGMGIYPDKGTLSHNQRDVLIQILHRLGHLHGVHHQVGDR